jgi:hypothetical protein
VPEPVPETVPDPRDRIPPFPLMRGQNGFGHIPFTEQSKRDVFITVFKNIFTSF